MRMCEFSAGRLHSRVCARAHARIRALGHKRADTYTKDLVMLKWMYSSV